MSKIVIVGGKLQGSEAAYLGREAGIDIVLIDKDPQAPAQELCTKFICGDVLSDDPEVVRELESADMILPTMENDYVLEGLTELCSRKGYVLAFDWEAYKVTSSKKISDRLFADNGLPCPRYYPDGNYPFIAKPESESGSHGVQVLADKKQLDGFLEKKKENYIIQEFVEGPSYSVEIIGVPGNYRTYETTEIFVDDVYDCNLAAALHTIEPGKKEKLESLAVEIAELIGLRGIMDLEVIDHHGEIKILEIDARLPSQTSIVVYHASGMNYIKELYDLFCHGNFTDEQINEGRCASLIHYLFEGKQYSSHGEHIMVEGGRLKYTEGLCSRAVVMSDYNPAEKVWRGTFVNWADDLEGLEKNEALMRNELAARLNLSGESDVQ
ncbi:MAG: 3-methylornithine--L-lysine ligase PylC [Lentihominibacter sp.]|nr:3-methylornithine--L-lysine ligase PylC [Clostridiales bacterium]MDY2680054.1 3-methylornithine--L-lysine ligase PylC [Lentihominibacter sp.]